MSQLIKKRIAKHKANILLGVEEPTNVLNELQALNRRLRSAKLLVPNVLKDYIRELQTYLNLRTAPDMNFSSTAWVNEIKTPAFSDGARDGGSYRKGGKQKYPNRFKGKQR